MVSKTLNIMNKIKSRKEWLNEKEQIEFDSLHEDEVLDVDIKVDDDPTKVAKELEGMEGVDKKETLPFGVIKAKVKKKRIPEIKDLEGVEGVELQKKK